MGKDIINKYDSLNRLLFLLVIILKFNLSFCDEAPSWSPYKVFSENKKYFCWVDFNDTDTSKYFWDKKWVLKVYKNDSTYIWQKDFQFTGYPDGFLSDDGEKFVYVEYWYPDNTSAVTIINGHKQNTYFKGRDFHIPELFLKPTVSHKLWLEGYSIENDYLIIYTQDGRKWLIDINDGKMQLAGFYLNTKNCIIVIILLLFLTLSIIIIRMKIRKNNT